MPTKRFGSEHGQDLVYLRRPHWQHLVRLPVKRSGHDTTHPAPVLFMEFFVARLSHQFHHYLHLQRRSGHGLGCCTRQRRVRIRQAWAYCVTPCLTAIGRVNLPRPKETLLDRHRQSALFVRPADRQIAISGILCLRQAERHDGFRRWAIVYFPILAWFLYLQPRRPLRTQISGHRLRRCTRTTS